MFRVTSSNGFHLTFANGYTVSVQWNPHSYCGNRNLQTPPDSTFSYPGAECTTAEVAAWHNPNGEWVKLGEDDDVVGWQTVDQVAAIIDRISKLPSAS